MHMMGGGGGLYDCVQAARKWQTNYVDGVFNMRKENLYDMGGGAEPPLGYATDKHGIFVLTMCLLLKIQL